MNKLKLNFAILIALIIGVSFVVGCEKNEIEEVKQGSAEITTFENFFASVEERIISTTENYVNEDGMIGTLYLIHTKAGEEQEILVLNKEQQKVGIPWVWWNGTAIMNWETSIISCLGDPTNCTVRFGKIVVDYD